jgi:hypothetical protein
MNIFFLDKTPEKSARYLCDKHVPKMLLESAQMLSTAVQKHKGRIEELYKPAYPNHPMTIWVGECWHNFNWALQNAIAIHDEYKFRFDKIHKSYRIIEDILHNDYKWDIPNTFNFTRVPQCMPDEYKKHPRSHIKAYRDYYAGEKEYFAKWERGRNEPKWFKKTKDKIEALKEKSRQESTERPSFQEGLLLA